MTQDSPVSVDRICPLTASTINASELRKLAKSGDANAMAELGRRYAGARSYARRKIKKDIPKSMKLLRDAAALDSITAHETLGFYYLGGRLGVMPSAAPIDEYRRRGCQHLIRAAELGSTKAQLTLIYLLIDNPSASGLSASENEALSFHWCKVHAQDKAHAQDWYAPHARELMRNLAIKYRDGVGTERDVDKALYWFRKMAEGTQLQNPELDDLLLAASQKAG